MTQTVPAIYEDGVFRPLSQVNFENHQKVQVIAFSLDTAQADDSAPLEGLLSDIRFTEEDFKEAKKSLFKF